MHKYLTKRANRIINAILLEITPNEDLDPDNVEELKRNIEFIVDREIRVYFDEEESNRQTVPESYLIKDLRTLAKQERRRNPYLSLELENIAWGLKK